MQGSHLELLRRADANGGTLHLHQLSNDERGAMAVLANDGYVTPDTGINPILIWRLTDKGWAAVAE